MSKKASKKRAPRPKQTEIEAEGFKQDKIAAIEKAAEAYEEARDERMALTETEVAAKATLLNKMHEHKITTYKYEGSDGDMRTVEVLPSEKVKVRKQKAEGDDVEVSED